MTQKITFYGIQFVKMNDRNPYAQSRFPADYEHISLDLHVFQKFKSNENPAIRSLSIIKW